MAFTPIVDTESDAQDWGIISELADQPNIDDEHDGAWLKAKFDAAGKMIAAYINNVLLLELTNNSAENIQIAAIETLPAADLQTMLEEIYHTVQTGITDGSILPQHLNAAFRLATQFIADGAVTTDKIAAGGVAHENLGNSVVERNNIKDGEIFGNKIANGAVSAAKIADRVNNAGAVSTILQATIPSTYEVRTDNWTASGANYTQTFDVSGIVSGTDVTVTAAEGASAEVTTALSHITFAKPSTAGKVTATSTEEVTIDLPVKVTQGSNTYNVTIYAETVEDVPWWVYDGPPYMQEISVSGMQAGKEVTYSVNPTDSEEAKAAFEELSFAADVDTVVVSTDVSISVDIHVNALQDGNLLSFTVAASEWNATGLPYKQDISVPGLLSSDTPVVDAVFSDDYEVSAKEVESWAVIYRMEAGNDVLHVYAQDTTTAPVNIQLLCVRK